MPRKKFILPLIFIVISLLISCKQPIDYLTPVTQTGQNTLSFLIDGKPYIPQGSSQLLSHNNAVRGGLYSSDSKPGRSIYFSTYSSTDNNGSISVNLGDYKIGMNYVNNGDVSTGNLIGRQYYATYTRGNSHFFSSSTYPGWVNITRADTSSGIVAGTFEFILADTSGNTVTITNGRFDLNANTQR